MKRFSAREIIEKGLKVRYYDWFEYYAGYKVIDAKNNVIGYITFNTAMKLPKETFLKKEW